MIFSKGMSFFQRSEITSGTSIFFDLYQKDKIGHKIVSTIECEDLDVKQTLVFMKHKAQTFCRKYPHFHSRIQGKSWHRVETMDYDKMIFMVDKSKNDIMETILNESLNQDLPGWQIIVTNDNCIMFICDHIYGDGAFIANLVRELFDDKSLNNLPVKREKRNISLLSKIFLFFRILFLIYKRFTFSKKVCAPWSSFKNKQFCLGTLSLSNLKKIRDRFSCKDETYISINDLVHTIIVKTNSLYFKKDTITSAAMFNMRENMEDFNDQNKLGYILLANKLHDNLPETLLGDVHDFMTFYKSTPATLIISKLMHWYYSWDSVKACRLIKSLNTSVDFIISNYMFQYKDKHIQNGIKVSNAYGSVTPCDANQMYSVTTYGDNVNIYLTYRETIITDVEHFQNCFDETIKWLQK
jgi:hypothetical protein